jgi:hypothetical protein
MLATHTLGFFANAIDLALELLIGLRTHTRKFRGQPGFSFRFHPRDFFGGGAGGGFACSAASFVRSN